MERHSAKYKDLSEQLSSWWRTQTDFKTKKALASFLKVHPDTLGEYFSGRSFPRSDIANMLCELTNIECLKSGVSGNSSTEIVSQDSATAALLPNRSSIATLIEGPQEPVMAKLIGHRQEESHPGESPEVMIGHPPRELPPKGGRYGEISVVISLQRTKCPFCAHDIARLRGCAYCGQHFVWANVPLENSGPV